MSVETKSDTSAKGILIVEDNSLLSLVYEMQILKLGHHILANVTTGEKAIDAVKDLNPDLVIMDIYLDGNIDGIEAMERIREFSHVPVIYISCNSDAYSSQRVRKTDYIDFLIKPVNNRKILRTLSRALN